MFGCHSATTRRDIPIFCPMKCLLLTPSDQLSHHHQIDYPKVCMCRKCLEEEKREANSLLFMYLFPTLRVDGFPESGGKLHIYFHINAKLLSPCGTICYGKCTEAQKHSAVRVRVSITAFSSLQP